MTGTIATWLPFIKEEQKIYFDSKSQDYIYGKESTRVLGKNKALFETWK